MPYPYAPQPMANPWLKAARSRYSRLGAALCVLIVVWNVTAIIICSVVRIIVSDGVYANAWVTFLLNDVPLYGIALPLALLTLSGVRPVETRRLPMRLRDLFAIFLIMIAVMYIGSLLGSSLAAFFSSGESENPIDDLVGNSVWADLVFAVIVAPIGEEFIFRKCLVSRARVFGEKTAIVFSALAFALFHANLYQAFYTFGTGLLLAYVYVRTSNMWYSVGLHAAMNFVGGTLSPAALTCVQAQTDDNGELIAGAYGNPAFLLSLVYVLALLAAVIAGIVLLIVRWRRATFYAAPCQLPRGKGGVAMYGNAGVIVYTAICVLLMFANLYLS